MAGVMKFKEVSDIFEVAVRIERHSVELYVSLFRASRSSRAKEVFSILAAGEEKHLGQVRALLEESANYVPRYTYPGEYELFVDGMASRVLESYRLESRPHEAASGTDAAGIGIGLEKSVIAFYSDLLDQFEGGDRSLLEELISEEREHLEKLVELQKTYAAEGE